MVVSRFVVWGEAEWNAGCMKDIWMAASAHEVEPIIHVGFLYR
jgi:hypothetical protein